MLQIYFGGAKICDVTNLGGAIALLCSLTAWPNILYFIIEKKLNIYIPNFLSFSLRLYE
jgi:hypothetical protein